MYSWPQFMSSKVTIDTLYRERERERGKERERRERKREREGGRERGRERRGENGREREGDTINSLINKLYNVPLVSLDPLVVTIQLCNPYMMLSCTLYQSHCSD